MRPKRTPGMPLKKPTGPTWLEGKLAALGFDSYDKYLASPHWVETRARYYEDPHTTKECLCGATEDLHLHHTTYFRLGGELLEDLRPLCSRCHTDVHVLARQGLMDLKLQGYTSDLRKSRYARERREMIANQGHLNEAQDEEPFKPEVSARNAENRRVVALDRRQAVKEAMRRTRRKI